MIGRENDFIWIKEFVEGIDCNPAVPKLVEMVENGESGLTGCSIIYNEDFSNYIQFSGYDGEVGSYNLDTDEFVGKELKLIIIKELEEEYIL